MTKFRFEAEPLTEHQQETLVILVEECAEIQQRAAKIIRFGAKEIQPGQELNNIERLSMEIGDLKVMIDIATKAELIDVDSITKGANQKHTQLEKFMKTYGEYNGF